MLVAVISLGALGLVLAVGLVIANRYLQVKEDPLVEKITELLPGANCGGCGYAGCSAFAKAIVEKGVDFTLCAPSSEENLKKIAELLGKEVKTTVKKVAIVLCAGDNNNAKKKYKYHGDLDCRSVNALGGGDKLCEFGCLGYGSCEKVCMFDAIHVTSSGVAVVDPEKCTGCGKCVEVCPRGIIKLVPKDAPIHILCSSPLKGKIVKEQCSVGCISCKLCTKSSPLIFMDKDLAKVNYDELEKLLMDEKFIEKKEENLKEKFPEEIALVCPSSAIVDLRHYTVFNWITDEKTKEDFRSRVKRYKEEQKKKREAKKSAKKKEEAKEEASKKGGN